MNCGRLPDEDLVAWLDGELDGDEASRVAAHVAACAACGREAALLKESGELLARLPGAKASAGFEARVVAAATSPNAATAGRGRLVFQRLGRNRPRVAAAAAVLVGVAAGVWWLSPRDAKDDAQVLTAKDEEALAEDLVVISNLDALQKADPNELAQLAEDLDVIDALSEQGVEEDGG